MPEDVLSRRKYAAAFQGQPGDAAGDSSDPQLGAGGDPYQRRSLKRPRHDQLDVSVADDSASGDARAVVSTYPDAGATGSDPSGAVNISVSCVDPVLARSGVSGAVQPQAIVLEETPSPSEADAAGAFVTDEDNLRRMEEDASREDGVEMQAIEPEGIPSESEAVSAEPSAYVTQPVKEAEVGHAGAFVTDEGNSGQMEEIASREDNVEPQAIEPEGIPSESEAVGAGPSAYVTQPEEEAEVGHTGAFVTDEGNPRQMEEIASREDGFEPQAIELERTPSEPEAVSAGSSARVPQPAGEAGADAAGAFVTGGNNPREIEEVASREDDFGPQAIEPEETLPKSEAVGARPSAHLRQPTEETGAHAVEAFVAHVGNPRRMEEDASSEDEVEPEAIVAEGTPSQSGAAFGVGPSTHVPRLAATAGAGGAGIFFAGRDNPRRMEEKASSEDEDDEDDHTEFFFSRSSGRLGVPPRRADSIAASARPQERQPLIPDPVHFHTTSLPHSSIGPSSQENARRQRPFEEAIDREMGLPDCHCSEGFYFSPCPSGRCRVNNVPRPVRQERCICSQFGFNPHERIFRCPVHEGPNRVRREGCTCLNMFGCSPGRKHFLRCPVHGLGDALPDRDAETLGDERGGNRDNLGGVSFFGGSQARRARGGCRDSEDGGDGGGRGSAGNDNEDGGNSGGDGGGRGRGSGSGSGSGSGGRDSEGGGNGGDGGGRRSRDSENSGGGGGGDRNPNNFGGDLDGNEEPECRVCRGGDEGGTRPLAHPCACRGSIKYVHQILTQAECRFKPLIPGLTR